MAKTDTTSRIASKIREDGYAVRVAESRIIVKVPVALATRWVDEYGARNPSQAADAMISGLLASTQIIAGDVAIEPRWTGRLWELDVYAQR